MTYQAPSWPSQPQTGQPYPGQPYPGQPYPGQPYPGQPYPGQPYPGQPYPGQAGQPYPGQAYPGQTGQPYPGQPYQAWPGQPLQTPPPLPARAPRKSLFHQAWTWIIVVVIAVPTLAGMGRGLLSAVEAAASDEIEVSELAVGDCTGELPPGDEVDSVDLVPCEDEHSYEAYASKLMKGDAYPGKNEVTKRADTFCTAEFATFVGIPYDESRYVKVELWPTKESWRFSEDREIICLVGDDTGRTTGSLKATKK